MTPLSILVLSDGRPGHYHLCDGVAAAIARRRPVLVQRLDIRRRKTAPNRLLAALLAFGRAPAALRLGYSLDARRLPRSDLVVSAGGDTVAANVAIARETGARNVHCGTLKHVPDTSLTAVVSSYDRHASRERHIVALKPSSIDPDSMPPRSPVTTSAPPRRAGLLIGGDSGLFRYQPREWQTLLDFLGAAHVMLGTRWIVSTSRRTPDAVADLTAALARRPNGPIDELIDFRAAGPGTLPRLFRDVDAVLATADSSTMVSEAISARLPVVGVTPHESDFKDEEREYRAFMMRNGWSRFLPLAELTPQRFLDELSTVTPLSENPLDRLAGELARLGVF